MEVKFSITSLLPFLPAKRCSHKSGKCLPGSFHLKFQFQTDVNQIFLWLQRSQEKDICSAKNKNDGSWYISGDFFTFGVVW